MLIPRAFMLSMRGLWPLDSGFRIPGWGAGFRLRLGRYRGFEVWAIQGARDATRWLMRLFATRGVSEGTRLILGAAEYSFLRDAKLKR